MIDEAPVSKNQSVIHCSRLLSYLGYYDVLDDGFSVLCDCVIAMTHNDRSVSGLPLGPSVANAVVDTDIRTENTQVSRCQMSPFFTGSKEKRLVLPNNSP